MTDKELLEYAAKSDGIENWWDGYSDDGRKCGAYWNPLLEDGDALRLAVKLRLDVLFYYDQIECVANTGCEPPEPFGVEGYGNDPYAATRRAIVRAAAEIGKVKK